MCLAIYIPVTVCLQASMKQTSYIGYLGINPGSMYYNLNLLKFSLVIFTSCELYRVSLNTEAM